MAVSNSSFACADFNRDSSKNWPQSYEIPGSGASWRTCRKASTPSSVFPWARRAFPRRARSAGRRDSWPRVAGNDNHAELVRWFDALWEEAQDFDETLMHEMKQSWAVAVVRPYDIYMKTLYALVKDRLEGEDDKDVLLGR